MNLHLQQDKDLLQLSNNIFDQTKTDISLKQTKHAKFSIFLVMLGTLVGSSSWIILTKDIPAITVMVITVFALLVILYFWLTPSRLCRFSILEMLGIMLCILGDVGFLIICFRIPYLNKIQELDVCMILMCNIQICTIGFFFIIVKILVSFFHLKQNTEFITEFILLSSIGPLIFWLSTVITQFFISYFLAQ
jgi:hypothetical protein